MTATVLEGQLVDDSTDFDPIILQSGRVSELSSEFEPDVTRVTCKTFEGLARKVEDDEFAEFLVELRQNQDRKAIMEQVRRSMLRALPAPEPATTGGDSCFIPPAWPVGEHTMVNAHGGGGEYAPERSSSIVAYVGEREFVWTEPDEDLLEEFTDAFPKIEATATDIPVYRAEEAKKTGARYENAFWGEATLRYFAKPPRTSLRSKLRSAWKYLLRVRRSGQ